MPTFNDLARLLRAGAAGAYADEAAVQLLITHQLWLLRSDFTHHAIEYDNNDAPTRAVVNWPTAVTLLDTGCLPCSRSEANILAIGASLASPARVPLAVISNLDPTNLAAVLTAIAHAGGHRHTQVKLG